MNTIQNYIRERLAQGDVMTTILDDIADQANAILAEQERAAQEKVKYEKAKSVLNATRDFLIAYYPGIAATDAVWETISGKDLCDMIDEMMPLYTMLNAVPKKECAKPQTNSSADEILRSFIEDLRL